MVSLLHRIILTSFVSLFFIYNGQAQTEGVTKKLLDSSSIKNGRKKILLLETDSFIVLATMEQFKKQFKKWIVKHPDLEEDKKLFQEIFKDTLSKLIDASKIAIKLKLTERLEFRIADMLENGKCIIYNKKTKRLEKSVRNVKYSTGGYGGTQFKIGNTIILETIEWIE
jgi:hypothetical protein